MKAIDFSIENGVTGMKMNALLECVENAKSRGDDVKAQMIVRRLNELKKVSCFFKLDKMGFFKY